MFKDSKNEPRGLLDILLVVLTVLLSILVILNSFALMSERTKTKELKAKAVELGAGEWVTGEGGDPEFKWKEVK